MQQRKLKFERLQNECITRVSAFQISVQYSLKSKIEYSSYMVSFNQHRIQLIKIFRKFWKWFQFHLYPSTKFRLYILVIQLAIARYILSLSVYGKVVKGNLVGFDCLQIFKRAIAQYTTLQLIYCGSCRQTRERQIIAWISAAEKLICLLVLNYVSKFIQP